MKRKEAFNTVFAESEYGEALQLRNGRGENVDWENEIITELESAANAGSEKRR